MRLRLYLSTNEKVSPSNQANQGFDEALELLAFLKDKGFDCESIDTSQLSDRDIQEAYMEAIYPSVRQKFGIRRIFGTRRRSGCFFGKGVPALFAYEDDSRHPIDVYPHGELGRVIPIKEFLESLIEKEHAASVGASRLLSLSSESPATPGQDRQHEEPDGRRRAPGLDGPAFGV